MNRFKRFKNWFKKQYFTLDGFLRSKATQNLEWEVGELEHIFTLISLGFFIGLPASPAPLALNLLPDMEDQLFLMINRLDTAHSPLSVLFSSLDVG